VSTRGAAFPVVDFKAFDFAGKPLEISAPDQKWTYSQAAAETKGQGQVSFEVLRDGERIASENLTFEVRSRSIACEWDLP